MIKHFFSNHKRFALVFFLILFVDILVKLNLPPFPYRFISKPFLLLSLFGYFYFNKTGNKSKQLSMFLALTCFFIGDILVINHASIIFLSFSLFFFSVGKIFLSMRFSHKRDFKVSRLIPFTILIFCYVIFLIGFLYKSIKGFFIPALISFFLTLLMFQFAYLRKDVFNKKSYMSVLLGIFLYTMSEGIMAIKTFETDFPFQNILIMLLYGSGMYFVVYGVINEKKIEHELLEEHEHELNLF